MTSPGLAQGCLDSITWSHRGNHGLDQSHQHGVPDGPMLTIKPQHHSPPFLLRLQGLLTPFARSFASFNHSTCALSVPCLYFALQGIHLALQTAVPSNSTHGCRQPHQAKPSTQHHTGQYPSLVAHSRVLVGAWHDQAQPPAPIAHSIC